MIYTEGQDRNVKAFYRRALARKELGDLSGARAGKSNFFLFYGALFALTCHRRQISQASSAWIQAIKQLEMRSRSLPR